MVPIHPQGIAKIFEVQIFSVEVQTTSTMISHWLRKNSSNFLNLRYSKTIKYIVKADTMLGMRDKNIMLTQRSSISISSNPGKDLLDDQ